MPLLLVYEITSEGIFTGPENNVPLDYAKVGF
ncbi:unnamed protein product [Acanthoscelides obtectus]|nr:unnamed protein product [Acanthoscelides obtectus]CAK1622511.1 hypothetical protein AOBTE_LOCUS1529 [Acanthoscelides obtectus]